MTGVIIIVIQCFSVDGLALCCVITSFFLKYQGSFVFLREKNQSVFSFHLAIFLKKRKKEKEFDFFKNPAGVLLWSTYKKKLPNNYCTLFKRKRICWDSVEGCRSWWLMNSADWICRMMVIDKKKVVCFLLLFFFWTAGCVRVSVDGGTAGDTRI